MYCFSHHCCLPVKICRQKKNGTLVYSAIKSKLQAKKQNWKIGNDVKIMIQWRQLHKERKRINKKLHHFLKSKLFICIYEIISFYQVPICIEKVLKILVIRYWDQHHSMVEMDFHQRKMTLGNKRVCIYTNMLMTGINYHNHLLYVYEFNLKPNKYNLEVLIINSFLFNVNLDIKRSFTSTNQKWKSFFISQLFTRYVAYFSK